MERGLRDEGKKDLKKQFDELCKDQKYCALPIKYSWFNLQCRDRLDYYSAASRYRDAMFQVSLGAVVNDKLSVGATDLLTVPEDTLVRGTRAWEIHKHTDL